MQNVVQRAAADAPKVEKGSANGQDIGNSPSTPHSADSSPVKSETDTYSERRRFMSDSSESDEDSVSEVESFVIDQDFEEDPQVEAAKFLLTADEDRAVDPETQARLEALLHAAGIGQLTTKDGKLADPEVLRRLTSSVSCALDEAAAALTRMRTDSTRPPEKTSLVEATVDGDVRTVRKLLGEGRSVHETSEEGESLLSLACSAGYFELAQVLLAMHANVEDRGIKGECTPLMEAASAGHLDIVRLLVAHGADVNAQSSSGNTPLMYGCAGGHTEVVKYLLGHGANVEDHNENGHTPLMEAASAGHVELAKILLSHGAGINTHSNEFKESALTLACYKGHLDMVRFLLEAGADQEHKTDEMHTALMEASMDGHVEVARLLLDSGAQVNMPTDSFESPLTLAACGGHVDLAMLLIERGANIEEVNDEGYTPLMEAAREGHEEMVALLLSQGANINAQTDETQETALTLACCGGFSDVADFLIKAGADIELGASTPLMEAAQEGHLELVKYLLENQANVRAQTQTGDTALTYACENGHTDVADLLLQFGADLEHESEGGRTPLMKACRAGHLCTVQFLISKGADVNKQTTNNDHTPLSLACAGGHLPVVELLLANRADLNHKLKDNSTMLIEAAKGGHTTVVQLLLDYPHSLMLGQQGATTTTTAAAAAAASTIIPGQVCSRDSPLPSATLPSNINQPINFLSPSTISSPVLQEVPEAVRIVTQEEAQKQQASSESSKQSSPIAGRSPESQNNKNRKSAVPQRRSSSTSALDTASASVADVASLCPQALAPLTDLEDSELFGDDTPGGSGGGGSSSLIDFIKNRKKQQSSTTPPLSDEGTTQKQAILEEIHQVERELHGKQSRGHLLLSQFAIPQDQCAATVGNATLPHMLNLDIAMQQQGLGSGMSGSIFPASNLQVHNTFYTGACMPAQAMPLKLAVSGGGDGGVGEGAGIGPFTASQSPSYYFAPLPTNVAVPLSTATTSAVTQAVKFQTITSHTEVSQSTAISDRPKAKPVSKKEGKNVRKQQPPVALFNQQQQQSQVFMATVPTTQQQQQQQQPSLQQQQSCEKSIHINDSLNCQGLGLDLDAIEQETLVIKDDAQSNLLTASILQQFHNTSQLNTIRAAFVGSTNVKNEEDKEEYPCPMEVQTIETYDVNEDEVDQHDLQIQPYSTTLDETMLATLDAAPHDLTASQADGTRLEYFVPQSAAAQLVAPTMHYHYEQYLQAITNVSNKDQTGAIYQAGFQAGMNVYQQAQQLVSSSSSSSSTAETLNTSSNASPNTTVTLTATTQQQQQQQQQKQQQPQPQQHYVQPVQTCVSSQPTCSHIAAAAANTAAASAGVPPTHHCQVPCSQHQHLFAAHQQQQQQQASATHQVQAATQTPQSAAAAADPKKQAKVNVGGGGTTTSTTTTGGVAGGAQAKKGRLLLRNQNPNNQSCAAFAQANQTYANADANATAASQFSGDGFAGGYAAGVAAGLAANAAADACATAAKPTANNYCVDLDSETESNHDTALTLACAGGHEDLVELLLKRGADIEHRDKKGFTPLILAATAGHEKVVEILLNHGADIEAQSERTKDTPLSLACSGGRYEVVELLINRGANKEHRNVSDYTPLSLAASGGYVNIIKLLLNNGAEINSRTGSKLGISPLMLAAMNGHTSAVKLLLDTGSDINAQIETNRNTALTLACFQGRHEVVSLLLDRKANVEHRAKTGLTPLMEAASGGYVEVGRVLLDKGADVNATPVPSSRDTALTIAADKGHCRFVELLLCRGAAVEVKNKKGNSPLWLAANGGHLSVVELLYNLSADIDSQDNRKVSCLMAAFRKGHVKVVKWMVNHVTQFPSDQEMIRYISTISDKELLDKCQECVKIIRAAKETQAAKANKNASILLEELDMEKNREESKKAAAARRRERKKKKKLEKREEKRRLTGDPEKNDDDDEDGKKMDVDDKVDEEEEEEEEEEEVIVVVAVGGAAQERRTDSPLHNEGCLDKEEGDSGIDANSQGSCSSNDVKTKEKRKEKKKKKTSQLAGSGSGSGSGAGGSAKTDADFRTTGHVAPFKATPLTELKELSSSSSSSEQRRNNNNNNDAAVTSKISRLTQIVKKGLVFEASRHPAEREDFQATGNETYVPSKVKKSAHDDVVVVTAAAAAAAQVASQATSIKTSPKQSSAKREEGWKEVVRKSSVQTVTVSDSGVKKVSVPLNAISRVIGRGGSNINAIRGATGAHIEVEKQCKGQGERIITLKGSMEATKQAHNLISALIKDPDVDILQMLPKPNKSSTTSTSLWDKTQIGTKKIAVKALTVSQSTATTTIATQKTITVTTPSTSSSAARTSTTVKPRGFVTASAPRVTAPRLVAQAERNAAALLASNTKNSMSYTSTTIISSGRGGGGGTTTSKVITTTATQTFAAKLTETTAAAAVHVPVPPASTSQPPLPTAATQKPRATLAATTHALPPLTATATIATTQPSSNVLASPTKHHRPALAASAPPTMQHYQASSGKFPPFSTASNTVGGAATATFSASTVASAATAAAGTAVVSTIDQNLAQMGAMTHSPPPPPPPSLVTTHVDVMVAKQMTTNVNATTQEYSLFNSMAQPTWRQESNEPHKPINFASVTGGCSVAQPPLSTSSYMDNNPKPVDAAKAPGYRVNTTCSPVAAKVSGSGHHVPSSMPPSAVYSGYEHAKNHTPLAPIGSSVMHNRVVASSSQQQQQQHQQQQQQQQHDLAAHFYSNCDLTSRSLQQHMAAAHAADNSSMYKTSSVFAESPNLLNMPVSDAQHLLANYPKSNCMQQQQQQHMSYAQSGPGGPMSSSSSVSMSRLNPKAPDFSVHSLSKPPVYNGFPLGNPNNNVHGGGMGKPSMGNYHHHRAAAAAAAAASSQNRWPILPMSQPFTQQQQSELISGMAGMTLHSIARAAGGEILENGGELNTVGGSPAMSPNLPQPHNLHVDNHYMEERKPPQPIGTERARKTQHPNVDNNWMMSMDKMMMGRPWPANNAEQQRYPTHMRNQAENEYMSHLDSFQHGSQLDNPHGYGSIQYLLQQQQLCTPDFVLPSDPLKMDLPPWDGSRQSMNDLQDKPHQPDGRASNSKTLNVGIADPHESVGL